MFALAPAPVVLVVQACAPLAARMAALLERHGYAAQTVRPAEIDAAQIAGLAPDLVLLDVDLGPGLDGLALAGCLEPALRRRILLLGGDANGRASEVRALGCYGLLDKPVQDCDLVTAVADALWQLESGASPY